MNGCSIKTFENDTLAPGLVTIATSIMPLRVEAQQRAVNSWLKLGFNVVSLNLPGEVEHIQGLFPEVHFVTVLRPGFPENALPNVSISEMLRQLSAVDGRLCGIVNSDICLCAGNDFLAFIKENAADGMVFGSRIDVERDTFESGREYCLGFDYFFFAKNLITFFPSNDFYFGLPYWDYWLPLVLLLQRVKVKRLISPVAFHVKHFASWEHHLEQFGGKFVESLQILFHSHPETKLLSERFHKAITAGDIGECSETAHFMLRYAVESLTYPDCKRDAACVTINKEAFEDMKSMLMDYEERLAESEYLLESVCASKSWRLTEPLRSLMSKLRSMANNKS